jgi:hypothetical protein
MSRSAALRLSFAEWGLPAAMWRCATPAFVCVETPLHAVRIPANRTRTTKERWRRHEDVPLQERANAGGVRGAILQGCSPCYAADL